MSLVPRADEVVDQLIEPVHGAAGIAAEKGVGSWHVEDSRGDGIPGLAAIQSRDAEEVIGKGRDRTERRTRAAGVSYRTIK